MVTIERMPTNTDNSGSARAAEMRRIAASQGPVPAMQPNIGSMALDAQLGKMYCCLVTATSLATFRLSYVNGRLVSTFLVDVSLIDVCGGTFTATPLVSNISNVFTFDGDQFRSVSTQPGPKVFSTDIGSIDVSTTVSLLLNIGGTIYTSDTITILPPTFVLSYSTTSNKLTSTFLVDVSLSQVTSVTFTSNSTTQTLSGDAFRALPTTQVGTKIFVSDYILPVGTTTLSLSMIIGGTTYRSNTITIPPIPMIINISVTVPSSQLDLPLGINTGDSVTVDWGVGSPQIYTSTPISHIYTDISNYTISITGRAYRFGTNSYIGADLIISVVQWGNLGFTSLGAAFFSALRLVSVPNSIPSGIINMSYMFYSASAFNQDISGWNVSSVTDMTGMFFLASVFNNNISRWDVSKVTNMSNMFYSASAFNQDISRWDIGKVTNMSNMFYSASAFNQDISGWNVSSVTDMNGMFSSTVAFNQDISRWDVGNVTTMSSMFYNTAAFNSRLSWANTGKVTDMSHMFQAASVFNQNISGWDVGKVTNMSNMFDRAAAFNSGLAWANTGKVTTMYQMFFGASAFNQDISGWDVSKVTDMSYMFSSAAAFNQNISGWDVGKVTNMSNMFDRAAAFNQNISRWNVSSVINMGAMFYNAIAFNSGLAWANTSNVTDMTGMFSRASAFNQDISRWNVSSVISMVAMFNEASAFNQDISGWDVRNVSSMSQMFKDALEFYQDLQPWDTPLITNNFQVAQMLCNAPIFFNPTLYPPFIGISGGANLDC